MQSSNFFITACGRKHTEVTFYVQKTGQGKFPPKARREHYPCMCILSSLKLHLSHIRFSFPLVHGSNWSTEVVIQTPSACQVLPNVYSKSCPVTISNVAFNFFLTGMGKHVIMCTKASMFQLSLQASCLYAVLNSNKPIDKKGWGGVSAVTITCSLRMNISCFSADLCQLHTAGSLFLRWLFTTQVTVL